MRSLQMGEHHVSALDAIVLNFRPVESSRAQPVVSSEVNKTAILVDFLGDLVDFSGDVIDLLIYSTMYHHAAWPAGGVARRRSCPVSVSRLLPSTSSRAPAITLKRMLRFSCYSGGVEATPYSCLAPIAGVRQLRLASSRGARGIALACAPRFSHLDA